MKFKARYIYWGIEMIAVGGLIFGYLIARAKVLIKGEELSPEDRKIVADGLEKEYR